MPLLPPYAWACGCLLQNGSLPFFRPAGPPLRFEGQSKEQSGASTILRIHQHQKFCSEEYCPVFRLVGCCGCSRVFVLCFCRDVFTSEGYADLLGNAPFSNPKSKKMAREMFSTEQLPLILQDRVQASPYAERLFVRRSMSTQTTET